LFWCEAWLADSWLVDDESDSAGEEIGGGFSGIDLNELHGKGPVVGAENETVGKKVYIAEVEMRSVAHRIEVGSVWSIGRGGVVMAIDEHERFRKYERIHGLCIGRRNADGNKALPGTACIGGSGVKGLKNTRL